MTAADFDSLAMVLTEAYHSGRKAGYLFGLEDSTLSTDEVANRIDFWFSPEAQEQEENVA